jgi:hypothetical protein
MAKHCPYIEKCEVYSPDEPADICILKGGQGCHEVALLQKVVLNEFQKASTLTFRRNLR